VPGGPPAANQINHLLSRNIFSMTCHRPFAADFKGENYSALRRQLRYSYRKNQANPLMVGDGQNKEWSEDRNRLPKAWSALTVEPGAKYDLKQPKAV
jgi:hypothetical protein